MKPKPAGLAPKYGAQFQDESIANTYATRPPYSGEFFNALERLVSEGPRVLLDLGCGTGDVAIGLAHGSDRIDAVDPSTAMLNVARSRPGADMPGLHWICASAETFEYRGPYSLVVASESLHWMDWETVLPKIGAGLGPDAYLVIAGGRSLVNLPWSKELGELINRYSTNRDYQPYNLINELTERNLFREVGRETIPAPLFSQSIDHYIESFHTRNGFSRQRMNPGLAREFDEALRRLVLHYFPDGVIRGERVHTIVWGKPMERSVAFNT